MGGQDEVLKQQVKGNLERSSAMYSQAMFGREALTDYTIGTYKMGGFDQSAKYQALRSGIMDALAKQGPGNISDPTSFGTNAAARAEGISNVGGQKLMAGLDEMNRIRATLAGSGLATTNFAQQESELGVKAASMMDPNPTLSTVNAALGLGSAVYGGAKRAGLFDKKTTPPPQFGFGMQGSSLSNWATTPITNLLPPGQFSITGGPNG